MNILELKGTIHDKVSEVQDKTLLQEIYQFINDLMARNTSSSDLMEPNLTAEQQKELELAIEESYLEENWVDHEVVLKSLDRWLKK